MPTTVNGIGTHYYGKSNHSRRTGVCRACQRTANLDTYDTRLWFVVIFIPVIPLGRKRIIDECSICRRHFVADQDQFGMARQLSLSGAADQFRAHPTAAVALAVHAQMLAFHAHEEARGLRDEALAKFPHDASLLAQLAQQLDEVSDYESATSLYQRAYDLRPDLPEAREGLAWRKIVAGELQAARELIDFLERPGAGQLYPLRRLEQLADAYQRAGEHDKMLAICEHLLREAPEVGQHHGFRAFVQKSERALLRPASILPQRAGSWLALFDSRSSRFSPGQRWTAYLTLVGILVVVGMMLLNEYRRQHRTVHIRNEFGPGTTVTVDGTVIVPAGPESQVVLKEGPHEVTVTGALDERFAFVMQTGYWQRWTSTPVWVIDVGGAAPLVFETLYYAENPRPADVAVHVGEQTFFAPHVDYLFQPAPTSLHVDSSSAQVTKRRLSVASEPAIDVFQFAIAQSSREAALRYAESQLLLHAEDRELLHAYFAATVASDKERAKGFLRRRFEQRPVLVDWHRLLHELHPSAAERTTLSHEYDGLLKQEPNDAVLLYLRGRLAPNSTEARDFFDRSMAADPQLSWPWAALSYRALTIGDWAACKEYAQQARQRGHGQELDTTIYLARLGLGEAEALEQEYRESLAQSPPDDALAIVLLLTTVLAARGDADGARRALDDWQAQVPAEQWPAEFLNSYRSSLDFMLGDYDAVQNRVATGRASPELQFLWLLASDRPAEAAADAALAEQFKEPWKALALSLSFDLNGDTSAGDVWRENACTALARLDFDEVRAADVLRATQPPSQEQLDEIAIQPNEKALLLAALAMRFPEQRGELSALARRFTIAPNSFAPLVRKVLDRQP